ncbi:MAG: hypothetical protein AABY46_07290 [Nitrospirota bacterium]
MYLLLRDLWPGLSPRRINTDFTVEQALLLLNAEEGWQKKRKASAEQVERDGEMIGETEMLNELGAG